ncbi:DUF3231 family protein [Terrihalobacillus insolitus]|uniref:DUF3231 family protein n=1 Tax=Terrihalobacillus insolitus TaxID=2950438 RepID=UPI00233FC15F|nr:DUF3231 family protein [Terrihalobacillus insolitus]MDC3412934.1 DUF3231 family protein [Terrihalobacillus insolitus]
MKKSKIQLTAAEISNLWMNYQNDTMAGCVVTYFLANMEDQEIQSIFKYALNISNRHIEKVTEIFKQENYPIPVGFTDNDVNLDAPRLFSDNLYLHYILNMSQAALTSYSLALSLSSRDDIIQFYSECLIETKDLHNKSKKLAKEKGMYIRPPYLPTPDSVDFVKQQSFLAGWFDRRPLLGIETALLVYNAKRNAISEAWLTGFGQVTQSKEVRRYFEKGRELTRKHHKVFESLLRDEYLSGTINYTTGVTDSTVPPFSDKLMMYHSSFLAAPLIGQYGISIALSPRRDLAFHYSRLLMEVGLLSEDGANIMINNGWMEQPPKAADRET